MIKTKSLFFGIVFSIISSFSFSQNVIRCYTDENHQQLLQQFPELETNDQFEQWMQQQLIQNQASAIIGGVYYIPVIVHVIHNGVEWKDLEYDFNSWLEKKPKHCASLKLDPSTFHFLFIGNGYRRKGLDVLLKALSLIQHEDFHLSVIGKDKEINFYMHLAKKLHLENKVSFFGEQKEIKKFYQIADCLVIPSFYDPFANVTVEALAMGLFVVSSISNGGSEVLQESSGITLSSLLDIDELSSLLKETLSISKTWIRSQKIRESVKHLDFSQQTATLVDISLNS